MVRRYHGELDMAPFGKPQVLAPHLCTCLQQSFQSLASQQGLELGSGASCLLAAGWLLLGYVQLVTTWLLGWGQTSWCWAMISAKVEDSKASNKNRLHPLWKWWPGKMCSIGVCSRIHWVWSLGAASTVRSIIPYQHVSTYDRVNFWIHAHVPTPL